MPIGAIPVDPTTSVGQVRLTVGDTVYTVIEGDQEHGDFTYFSDDEISTAYTVGSESTTRAVGILVKQLALNASLNGQSIKADDFSINTLSRGADLLKVAESYFAQADAEDARYGREGAPGDEPGESIAIVPVRLKRSTLGWC